MAEPYGDREVIRNFTAARKFPQLIGRTPDGKRILGGPYTITQAVGAGLVVWLLYLTRGWWMGFGLIGSTLTVLLPLGGVVFGLGRLRPGGRNPISMLTGFGKAATATKTVKVDGRVIRTKRRTRTVAASGCIERREPLAPTT